VAFRAAVFYVTAEAVTHKDALWALCASVLHHSGSTPGIFYILG
jgi:hypothetical protein